MAERQQVLHLWLKAAALDTEVTAWAFYDGTAGSGPAPVSPGPSEPPYRTGVEAMVDGWFLLQAPGPIDPAASNGELSCEFVFQRRVEIEAEPAWHPAERLV